MLNKEKVMIGIPSAQLLQIHLLCGRAIDLLSQSYLAFPKNYISAATLIFELFK
jgi:hypothetical protein